MAKIRVADYITEYLYDKFNVEHIFMLSGGGSIYLDDSVALHPKVKDICVRNEATAVMMANGYVKSGAQLGVAYVTTGPGSANAVSGLVEAWVDSCPILIVSGQVNSYHTIQSKKQDGVPPLRSYGTQELDILSIVEPITKKCLRLENTLDVKKYLDELINIALENRKGPVWLEVPLDMQSAFVDRDDLEDDVMKLAVKLIKTSKKPLILAGQGIKGKYNFQETNFKELISTIDVPVILSRMGLDTLPYRNEYNLGIGGIRGKLYNKIVMKESDLIIAIGTTLSPAFVGYDMDFLGKDIIIVDINEAELSKFDNIDKNILKIKMDANTFCNEIRNRLSDINFKLKIDSWRKRIKEVKELNNIPLKAKTPIDIYDLVKSIDSLSKRGDIFVSDAGSAYYVTQQVLTFDKQHQKDLTSGAYASMGISIPLAIGAALKNPNERVIVITGDGSIETNIQELKTLSYYGLNVKIFIINNGGYISMRDHQDNLFDGRYINATAATGNPVLNFEDIAKAFGLKYEKIEDYPTMSDQIGKILGENGPVLVEVICDNNQKLINPLSTGDEHEWMA